MQNNLEIDAYVINVIVQKEADAIISFLTPDGYKQSYVRGVMRLKSKYKMLNNRLIKVRLTYQESNEYIKLKEVKLLAYPSEHALDYQTNLNLSNFCKEIIQTRSIDHQATYLIFDMLMHDLSNYKHYHLVFLANVTLSLGINFSLDRCAKCDSTSQIINFDLYEGGYLCFNCAPNKVTASLNELRTINQVFNHQIKALLENPVDDVFAHKLVDFINQTYGYKLIWE